MYREGLLMEPEKRQFGMTHPRAKRLAVYTFDLEDLYWLQSCISPGDGFQRDIQEAINWLEPEKETDAT